MASLSTAQLYIRTGRTSASELSSLRATRDSLSSQVSRLEDEIQAKKMEIQKIDLNIRHCDTLLAPIRRLPDELLLLVFSYAVDAFISRFACRIIVGRVCRHWRTLSRSSPSLWSTIDIIATFKFPNDSLGKPSCMLQLIEQCLVLSYPLPLDIVVNFDCIIDPDEEHKIVDYVDDVLRPLCSHATRWRSFRYSGPSIRESRQTHPNIDARLAFLHLETLESLDITFRGEFYHEYMEDPVYVPNLRILQTSITHHLFMFPYGILTTFTGPFEEDESCYEFLTEATNLTSLYVTHIGPHIEIKYPPLILSRLRTFKVNACAIVPLLNTITIPLLEEFAQPMYDQHTIKHPNGCADSMSDATTILQSLIERSRCSVRVLDIGGTNVPSTILKAFKDHGATLTRLRINLHSSISYDSHETLELLTLPALFPRLAELEIVTDVFEDILVRGHRLEEMLRSRWDVPGGGMLKRLRLELEVIPDDGITLRYKTSALSLYLRSQKQKGINVQFIVEGRDMLGEVQEFIETFM